MYMKSIDECHETQSPMLYEIDVEVSSITLKVIGTQRGSGLYLTNVPILKLMVKPWCLYNRTTTWTTTWTLYPFANKLV